MHLLVSYSPANEILFSDWFSRTFPEPESLLIRKLDGRGRGNYDSPEWQAGVVGKVTHVAEYIESCPDGVTFALADADIQFFDGFSLGRLEGELEASGCEILFQREFRSGGPPDVNTGFYVARISPGIREFFEEVRARLAQVDRKNDQTVINAFLPEADIRWGYLSGDYYARTQGFPPPKSAVLHHANGTKSNSLYNKITQLRRMRRYVTGGPLGRAIATFQEAAHLVASRQARTGK